MNFLVGADLLLALHAEEMEACALHPPGKGELVLGVQPYNSVLSCHTVTGADDSQFGGAE